MKKFKEMLKDENGQGMVEYGLILGLIAVAAVAVLIVLGPRITSMFQQASNALPAASASSGT